MRANRLCLGVAAIACILAVIRWRLPPSALTAERFGESSSPGSLPKRLQRHAEHDVGGLSARPQRYRFELGAGLRQPQTETNTTATSTISTKTAASEAAAPSAPTAMPAPVQLQAPPGAHLRSSTPAAVSAGTAAVVATTASSATPPTATAPVAAAPIAADPDDATATAAAWNASSLPERLCGDSQGSALLHQLPMTHLGEADPTLALRWHSKWWDGLRWQGTRRSVAAESPGPAADGAAWLALHSARARTRSPRPSCASARLRLHLLVSPSEWGRTGLLVASQAASPATASKRATSRWAIRTISSPAWGL